jgi:16S rRNA (cytosine967-C5)-methyltransferase
LPKAFEGVNIRSIFKTPLLTPGFLLLLDVRKIAVDALTAVSAGKKLDAVIRRAIRAGRLNRRDQTYAAALVKKVLRNRNLLDYQIEIHAGKAVTSIQPVLLETLRVATTEISLMRTANYAAVNEAVRAVRTEFGKSAAGFANAVLRRIAETPEPVLPDPNNEAAFLAVKYSHPEWLVKRWLRRFGRTECEDALKTNNEDAPLYVIHNPTRVTRCELAAAIRDAGADAETGPLETLRVELKKKPIADIPLLNDGRALIVDPSSTLGVKALSPPRGVVAFDMCAGAGGKSRQLAWAVGPDGKIIAADNVAAKVEILAAETNRSHAEKILPIIADLTKPLVRGAGYILVDAPCSNTGVLRRKPDVRWRIKEEELAGHAALQLSLLSEAVRTLAPGGKLVYQTCSTEPEENERVVEAVLAAFAEVELKKPAGKLFIDYADGDYLRTWPHRHGLNGAFIAVVRKYDGRKRKG